MNHIINIHNLKTSKYIYRARIEDNRSFKIDSQQQTRLTTKINLLFFKRRHFVLFTKPWKCQIMKDSIWKMIFFWFIMHLSFQSSFHNKLILNNVSLSAHLSSNQNNWIEFVAHWPAAPPLQPLHHNQSNQYIHSLCYIPGFECEVWQLPHKFCQLIPPSPDWEDLG